MPCINAIGQVQSKCSDERLMQDDVSEHIDS